MTSGPPHERRPRLHQLDLMPSPYEPVDQRVVRAVALDADPAQRREWRIGVGDPARCLDRGLRVEAVVDETGHQLDHRLRLAVAAHRPEGDLGAPAAEEHARHEGVEGPRARRQRVRMLRVEGEVGAAVLEHDPGRATHDPRAEAHVVRLDQADHHPVAASAAHR